MLGATGTTGTTGTMGIAGARAIGARATGEAASLVAGGRAAPGGCGVGSGNEWHNSTRLRELHGLYAAVPTASVGFETVR